MKSFAVSVLLLVGALLLGVDYCSGVSNGTDTTPVTPMNTGHGLTTVMNKTASNDTEPTNSTAQIPTDQPTVTTTEGSITTSIKMMTTVSAGTATNNRSTSVTSTMSTQPTTSIVPTTPTGQTPTTVQTTPTMPTAPTVKTMPTPEMFWKVMNGNNTCQLILFQYVTIKYYNTKGKPTEVSVSVPFEEPLSNVTGDCSSMEKRTFAIDFYPDSNRSGDPWTLRFVFKTFNLSAFHLTSLSFESKYDDHFDTTEEGQFSYTYSLTEGPLGGVAAPIGNSFSCANLLIPLADGLSIVFEDAKLQPFADKAQGRIGESGPCPYKPDDPAPPTLEQSNTWMVATIVVSVIFGVFFLGTVGLCYYVKKHQAPPSDTYSLMETY